MIVPKKIRSYMDLVAEAAKLGMVIVPSPDPSKAGRPKRYKIGPGAMRLEYQFASFNGVSCHGVNELAVAVEAMELMKGVLE